MTMGKHYSKTTGGFYADDVHAELPADAVDVSDEAYAALFDAQSRGMRITAAADGSPIAVAPSAPTALQLTASLSAAVQAHIDATARSLGYDSIATAVTYADEPAVPKFEAEGRALRAWRSQVWAACIATLAAVTAGTEATPTAAQLIASLPAFTPTTTTEN